MSVSHKSEKPLLKNSSNQEVDCEVVKPSLPKSKLAEKCDDDVASLKSVEQITWGSQLEFILACLGYSVGLGNIWRFPYLCMSNGGAAFLVAYAVCLMICATPLYFLEVCLGQFSGHSAITMWNISPAFKGLGYGMIVITTVFSAYYNGIIAWALYYLFRSFTWTVPWSDCHNSWNTPLCLKEENRENGINLTLFKNSTEVYLESDLARTFNIADYSNEARIYANLSANDSIPWRNAAEEFWLFEALEISGGVGTPGGIKWDIFACVWVTWIITFFCFIKGIKSVGKAVYVTAIAPYILLTILLIRATTLPGAVFGLKYYMVPTMSKLLEFKVWTTACLQVFYSLGPCWGGIVTMASFNKFDNNCVRDGILVPIVTGLTSFYGGIVVFSIVGFMAQQTETEVASFIQSGPGLVFIAYPRALALLPGAPIWSVLFFLMVFFVGMGTTFCTVEALIGSIVDEFKDYLKKYELLVTFVVCLVCALLNLIYTTRAGVYYVQITDWYVGTFSLMLIALLECLAICVVYGHERVFYDIELMTGRRPYVFWKVCWCILTPLLVLVMLIYTCISMSEPVYGDYFYPRWIIIIGWIIALSSVVPIPVYFIWIVLTTSGTFLQRMKKMLKPTSKWVPKDLEARKLYSFKGSPRSLSRFCNQKETYEFDREIPTERAQMFTTKEL